MACTFIEIQDEFFRTALETTGDMEVAARIMIAFRKSDSELLKPFLSNRYNIQKKARTNNGNYYTKSFMEAQAQYKSLLQTFDMVRKPQQLENGKWNVYVYVPIDWANVLQQNIDKLEGKTIKDIVTHEQSLGISLTGDSLIDYMPSTTNETEEVSNKYQKVLDDISNRINRKKRQIAADKSDRDKVTRLEAEIKELETRFDDISDAGTLFYIIDHGKNDIKKLNKLFSQNTLAKSDLIEADKVLYMWENVPLSTLFTDTELNAEQPSANVIAIKDIKARISRLREKYTKAFDASVVSTIQQISPSSTIEDILSAKKEISGLQSNLRDISTIGDITAQVMHRLVNDADYDMTQELNEVIKNVDEMWNKVRKTNIFKRNGFELFAQEKNGKKTGFIVDRFDQSFYDTKAKLLYSAKKFGGANWKKYFNWKKENNILFDLRKLFYTEYKSIDGKKTYSENEVNDHIQELKKHLGEKGYQFYYDRLKSKLERYKEDLDAQTEYINSLEGDDAEKMSRLDTWIQENSPFHYAEYVYDNVHSKVGTKFVSPKGYKYTYEVPRKFDENNNLTGWYDKKFETIESDESLYNFYRYAIEKFNDTYSYLPDYAVEDLQYNTLPEIHKTIAQIFSQSGMKEGLKGWYDKFLGEITEKEQSAIRGDIDPLTGLPVKSLPIKMLSQSLSPEEKSYDLPKIIKAFSMMGLSYKHKSRIEDSIKILQRAANQANERQENTSGQELIDRMGNAVEGKQGLKNYKEAINYFVEAAFYGNRKVSEGKFEKTHYTFKEQEELNNIEKKLKSPDLSEVEKLKLETRKETLGSHIVGSKAFDKVLSFAMLKGMGWNIFAPVNNIMFAYVANVTHGAGNEDFTIGEFHNALRLMLNNIGKSASLDAIKTPESQKINTLIEKFNIIGEIDQVAYKDTSHNSSAVKGIQKLAPMELTRRAEYLNQGSTFIAMMLHQKIEDISGKTRNLYEAYDKDGSWKEKEFGPEKNFDAKAFKAKVEQVKKIVHGNYHTGSPTQIKSKVLGRALMMFRGWIAEGFAARFQDEHQDINLGRKVKGRLRTWNPLTGGSIGRTQGVIALLDQMANFLTFGQAFGKSLNKLSEVDKANMRKNAAEVMLYTSLYLLILGLRHATSNDDKDKYAINATINLGLRVQNDMAFFTSPMAFEKISQSAIPAFSIIIDGAKFVNAAENLIVGGDDIYKRGPWKGESKTKEAFLRMFPGFTQVSRTISGFTHVNDSPVSTQH